MNAKTVGELFIQKASEFRGRRRFIAYVDGAWRDVSWDEYYEAAREIGLGLRSLGVGPGDRVCLLSDSRLEWAFCDTGIFCLGAVTVPIYATLTAEQTAYIVEHSGAAVVIVENLRQLEKVREQSGHMPELRHVVVIEGLPAGHDSAPQAPHTGGGVGAPAPRQPEAQSNRELSLRGLRQRGRERLESHPTEFEDMARAIKPEDPFTIIYTSGTTGVPKGVLTTHANYIAMIDMGLQITKVLEDDVDLLLLPLAHAYARLEHLAGIAAGLQTGFARSISTVVEDLLVVRPTLLFSVPRIYEKAYARILAKAEASPPLQRKLFHWSLEVGREVSRHQQQGRPLPRGLRLKYALAERLVFNKVKAAFGGRMRVAVSAASAISREILEFFHACGLLILEGYGMTETSTASHINPIDAYRFGTVGQPLPGVEQRIAEDGEVLVRGPNIMREYYRMPEETAETLKDGWLHTGDIGTVDADGYLTLTDRKTAMFKTSGGKWIAPTPVENELKTDPRVSQAIVCGARRKHVVALITLNRDEVVSWARKRGLPADDWGVLVRSSDVQHMVQRIVDRANAKLAQFETVKKFALLEQDFSIESGELTPSLKVRRKGVETKYAEMIDGLYDEVYD